MSERPILIVDDDSDVRMMLCALLSAEGYDVLDAGDGLEALERLRHSRPPAIVFVDLMMPRMDGERLIQEIKRDPSLATVPIVVMSGHTVAGVSPSRMSASAFLKKPFELDSLLSVVHQFTEPTGTPGPA